MNTLSCPMPCSCKNRAPPDSIFMEGGKNFTTKWFSWLHGPVMTLSKHKFSNRNSVG